LILYFDGLCEPKNPGGVATYGFVIYDGAHKVREDCGVVGAGMLGDDVSNNVAEYTAMIRGMECLVGLGHTSAITVRGDSQLAINQLLGKYAVKAKRLIPLYGIACGLKEKFKDVTFEWVPREKNEEADELSRKAFRQFLGKNLEAYRHYYFKDK
jgi:ribonuclease HI